MRLLLKLFLVFAKIGAFTFGGGYAMLPILQRELVDKQGWATNEELMDYFAIAQCTPGIIAVNTATFVGCRHKGIIGGIAATLGVVFPSVVIITVIAAFITGFAELAVMKNAFAAVRVCVCVLIVNAVVKLFKTAVIDKPTIAVFVLVFVGMVFLDLSPVFFIVIAAVLGCVIKGLGGGRA